MASPLLYSSSNRHRIGVIIPMKMKKKTRKKLTAGLAVFLCAIMILPVFAELFARPSSQERLANELLAAQIEASQMEENESDIVLEGSYLVTEVVTSNTYKVLWGDEERTVKLIGTRGEAPYLSEVKELVEAHLLTLAFDEVEQDNEGNMLVYAYLENGEFLNEKLVIEGYVSVKEETVNVAKQETLESAQVKAKNRNIGIWEQNVKETAK